MKNIFAIPDLETFIKENQINKKNVAELIIYKHIPLEFTDFNSYLYADSNEVKDLLIEELKSLTIPITIESIADLTLKLCDKYLIHQFTQENNTSMDSSFAHIINTSITTPSPETLERYQKMVYDESGYIEELKEFLILSHYYDQGKYNFKISDLESISLEKRKLKSKEAISNRYLYDKTAEIYKEQRKKGMSFLLPFMDYTQDSDAINFTSFYDIEILMGLIESTNGKTNPFFHLMGYKESDLLSIDRFLKLFKNISLAPKSQMDILDSLKKHNGKFIKIIDQCLVSNEKIWVYNQFLLERITNLNFINCLHALLIENPVIKQHEQSIIGFVRSPLLKFRLNILKVLTENTEIYLQKSPISLTNFIEYLNKIIHHQITCTLPIIILIFEYLVKLVAESKLKIADSSIDKYFEKIMSTSSNQFFKLNFEKIPEPIKYKIPFDIKKESYQDTLKKTYWDFIEKTHVIEKKENFFYKLHYVISKEQQKWLQERLSDPIWYTSSRGNEGALPLHGIGSAASNNESCGFFIIELDKQGNTITKHKIEDQYTNSSKSSKKSDLIKDEMLILNILDLIKDKKRVRFEHKQPSYLDFPSKKDKRIIGEILNKREEIKAYIVDYISTTDTGNKQFSFSENGWLTRYFQEVSQK